MAGAAPSPPLPACCARVQEDAGRQEVPSAGRVDLPPERTATMVLQVAEGPPWDAVQKLSFELAHGSENPEPRHQHQFAGLLWGCSGELDPSIAAGDCCSSLVG